MNRRGFLGRAIAALAAAVVAPPRTDRPDPEILRELDEMLGIVPEPAPVPAVADINAIWRKVQAQLMPGFRSLNDEWAVMPAEYDPERMFRDRIAEPDDLRVIPAGWLHTARPGERHHCTDPSCPARVPMREIRIPVDLHAANARTLRQIQAANEEMMRARALADAMRGRN